MSMSLDRFLLPRTDANVLNARYSLISSYTTRNPSPASIFIATSKREKALLTKKSPTKMLHRNQNLPKPICSPNQRLQLSTSPIVVKRPILESCLPSITWSATLKGLSSPKRAILKPEETNV